MIIKEKILNYAKKIDVFTIDEIAKELCVTNNDRHKLYNALSQLGKTNKLHRYQRGVYGYVFYNELLQKGVYNSEDEAFAQLYTRNDEGYVSGADFFYRISLSTWLPAKKTIVTNKVKNEKIGQTVVFLPPKTHITQQNKHYLQLLDCLETLCQYAIDAPNPYGLLKRYIQKRNLDIPTLINLAKAHYTEIVLEELKKCLEADCL